MQEDFIVKLENLKKSFGSREITKGLDLSIARGEFCAIIGGSGEGKSVLFKQIVGLIRPDSGKIFIDGKDITLLSDLELESVFKVCGYVFQFAALLDSLTVLENIGITLFEKGWHFEKVKEVVIKKLADVGLSEDILNSYPSELSGGMKKRVGLARTLISEPKILLYDEPTTGLDPITVTMIHKLIKSTHDLTRATTLVISHDVDIFNYADTVAMLFDGKIIFKCDAKTIWDSDNQYIHQFIRGEINGPIKK